MRNFGLLASMVFLCVAAAPAASRYETAVSKLNAIASVHPDLVQSFELAPNDQGQIIQGVRIALPDVSDDQGSNLLVATHHGNEGLSTEAALQFTKDLLGILVDASHPKHTALAARPFYVVPVLNISGYNANRREESYASGGTLDSNRDYPDPCGNDHTFRLKSTKALADFVAAHNVIGAVTIHGYIGSFTFPWGTYTSDSHTPDHDFYRTIGRAAVAHNGYSTGTHKDVIYPTVGAFEDWAYHAHGTWTMLMELDRSANLSNDSAAMLTYFGGLPAERSLNHEHAGRCTRTMKDVVRARP